MPLGLHIHPRCQEQVDVDRWIGLALSGSSRRNSKREPWLVTTKGYRPSVGPQCRDRSVQFPERLVYQLKYRLDLRSPCCRSTILAISITETFRSAHEGTRSPRNRPGRRCFPGRAWVTLVKSLIGSQLRSLPRRRREGVLRSISSARSYAKSATALAKRKRSSSAVEARGHRRVSFLQLLFCVNERTVKDLLISVTDLERNAQGETCP